MANDIKTTETHERVHTCSYSGMELERLVADDFRRRLGLENNAGVAAVSISRPSHESNAHVAHVKLTLTLPPTSAPWLPKDNSDGSGSGFAGS